MDKNQIRDLIGKSKITEIFKQFNGKKNTYDSDIINCMTVLEARYNNNERNQRIGQISNESYNIELQSIRYGLLSLFSEDDEKNEQIMMKNVILPGSIIKTNGDFHLGDVNMYDNNSKPTLTPQSKIKNENDYEKSVFQKIENLIIHKNKQSPSSEYHILFLELYRYRAYYNGLNVGLNMGISSEDLEMAIKKFYTTTMIALNEKVIYNSSQLYASLLDALKENNRRELHNIYETIKVNYNIDNPIFFNDNEIVIWGEQIKNILRENM